jgi:peptide/nickel transport system substrate-binding protein
VNQNLFRSIAAITVTLSLAACGGSEDPSKDSDTTTASAATAAPADTTGGETDTMVWAIQSAPASMNNAIASDVPTLRVQTAVFDRLLKIGNDGAVEPWIATAWENPDPLTWTFTIRDDVKFWDGTPLTAEDVAFSWARHIGADNPSAVGFNFASVDAVVASDAKTITVTLKAADPTIPAKSALYVQIIQQKYATDAGDALGGPDKPGMGTGPYSITKYSSAEGATLTRNDAYWAGTPKVETLEFKVIGDPETARLAISSGEIDGYFDVPLIATRQWDTLENATMSYVTGAYNDMLTMDVTRAPFDDVNARQAMAHLVDRDGLLTPLFNGRATSAFTVVPATQLASALGESGAGEFYASLPAVPEFSIDLAKAALAKSATPDGFEVDLPVDTSQPWMSPLAQSIADNAKELGITVNVVSVSAGDWVAGLTDPAASPLQLLALGAGTPWPGEIPPVIIGTNAGFNPARYAGADLDALVDQVIAATTLDELMPPLTDLLTKAGSDLAYMPLFDEQTAISISNKFTWDGGYSYWALGQAWPLQLGAAP